jgi:hypothetical protein
MQNTHPYYEKIESALTSSGFEKEAISSSTFTIAFTRRGFFSNTVFLVAEVEAADFNASSMKQLIESARQWCAEHLSATWFFQEAGFNLVLFHEGQIGSNHLKGQVDSTGFHAAICQSITALDVTNGIVAQEKTWVVIGKVRMALRKLNELA